MIYITLISLIIAILSLRYTLKIRTYLKEFILASQKIRNMELYVRMDESSKGELGELSKNFNSMISILDENILELEKSRIKTESILKSISDGILAIDINSKIMFINKEGKKILKCDLEKKLEGKLIGQVIKQKELLKEIKYNKGKRNKEQVEIKTKNGIVYRMDLSPIYLEDDKEMIIGTIINIRDITERVMLENMRSEFVTNVTHELKTPLTSISGFVETLRLNENIDVNTRNRFLGIIESESNRLKTLIDDVLLLSFVEEKGNSGQEILDIDNVYKYSVYDIVENLAKAKSIKIHYEIEDGNIKLLANKDYIKQVFINIIGNAIKYTDNDKNIYIKIYKTSNNIIISVRDEGIGIPKEDINRVFERFYRVDKARSRDIGGTGLGLAITKHIIKNMGGSISVKSELGLGSEFIIKLPIKNFLK